MSQHRDIMSQAQAAPCSSRRRVLAFDPMGLTNDLEPMLSKFLAEDRAERERRQSFLVKWETVRAEIETLMQEVVRLVSSRPAFNAEVEHNHIGIALSLGFKSASGAHTADSLTFTPDIEYIYIACHSTLDLPGTETENKLDLWHLDTSLIERKIRQFFERFLVARRYTGSILGSLGYVKTAD